MSTDRRHRPPSRDRARRAARASGGVLPVVLAVVLVGVVLVAVSPRARQAATASFSREAEPYVELYVADVRSARSCPTEDGGRRALVDARLTSRLGGTEQIPWRVTVATGDARRVVDGSTDVPAGSTGRVTTSVRIPGGADEYVVRVSLPGRSPELRIRCSGGDES